MAADYTVKVYKEMRRIEIMLFKDDSLSFLFNGLVDEYNETRFCELYEAANSARMGELESYSVFLINNGVRITEEKTVLWLDGYEEKAATEIPTSRFCDLLEIYRREWLKTYFEDLSMPTDEYYPIVAGIID